MEAIEKRSGVNTDHGISAASFMTNAFNLPNVDSLSDVVIYSFFASQSNCPQLDNEGIKQIDPNDLEEMDLKLQMAMLIMRTRRFLQKTRRNLGVKGTETICFDKTKVECYNCHKRGYFSRKCMASKHQDNRNRKASRRTVPVEDTTSNDLVSQCNGIGYDWNTEVSTCSKAYLKSYETLKEHYDNLTKEFNKSQFNLGAFKAGLESVEARLEVNDKYNSSEGYHAVLPPYIGNYMPPKPDLVFADEHVVNDSATSLPDWVSDSEDENYIETKQIKPSFAKVTFVKPTKHVKSLSKSMKQEEIDRQTNYPRKHSQSPKEIDGGYVAFGGDPKGEKITDTKCVVLSPKFKLLDESQVLLSVPRKNNMYSFNLKNIAPSGGTKANIDARQAKKKSGSGSQYVLLPLITTDSQGPKNSEDEIANNAGRKSTKVLKKGSGV
nr:hypothetical protein [Tanacetum cinerariifolium]